MNIQAGQILVSTDTMEDTNFQNSVVFITRHDANGTVGFVINKKFNRSLNDLEEFKHGPNFPLYDGGPVDKEHLYFVHRSSDLIEKGELVSDQIFFGGDFQQAISDINSGFLNTADVKIFIGYCGWDSNELETEVAEGSWKITNENTELLFKEWID
jgi:putative transcriptional regulator